MHFLASESVCINNSEIIWQIERHSRNASEICHSRAVGVHRAAQISADEIRAATGNNWAPGGATDCASCMRSPYDLLRWPARVPNAVLSRRLRTDEIANSCSSLPSAIRCGDTPVSNGAELIDETSSAEC